MAADRRMGSCSTFGTLHGKIHYHPFPEHVVKEGLFKDRLTALVAYMKAVDHASFSTIRKFIRDVLGEKVSRGYLHKVIAKASHALDALYEELLQLLPLEQKLNVDETGHKENGEKFWTWVFRADLYVLFKNGKEQKREACNMAKRFRKHGKADFEFITTPGMGPTTNIAEQAVRFVVIDHRITQGARSKAGRESNERLWTVVGTCALQGRSADEL